jgi:hypothetical protein
MKWLVVVALCACATGQSLPELKFAEGKVDNFAEELTRASTAQDIAGVRALLHESVTLGGLWFPETSCMIKFGAPGVVRGAKLDELARCLTTLQLKMSERDDALPDVVVLTYGHGIELEARFVEHKTGPWLAWIGYSARRDLRDALPTISARALETLRVEGELQASLAGPSALSDYELRYTADAWLKVCIDSAGAVTGAHVRSASSPSTARAFVAATQSWKFKPFMLGSQPAPVCAMVHMVHPRHRKPQREKLPYPLPADPENVLNVPSPVLGMPVEGRQMIPPDDLEKHALAESGLKQVLAAFHYCLDETGRVASVMQLRASGLAGWDRKIAGEIKGWRFKPFLDEGTPIRVCTSMHFLYSQGPGAVRVVRTR